MKSYLSPYLFISFLIISLTINIYPNTINKKVRIGKEITFQTEDGVLISGLFQPPNNPNKKTFILLHGLDSNQEEWQSFIYRLVKRGYGFLSYDLRGHGKSIQDIYGKRINHKTFGPPGPNSQWNRMVDDIKYAKNFLIKQKMINPKTICIIGASLGANIAISYGSKDTNIYLVVALSPGLDYAGIDIKNAIKEFSNRPIILAASPNDTYAYQSARIFYNQIQRNSKAKFLIGNNGGHGVQMLEGNLEKSLLQLLSRI